MILTDELPLSVRDEVGSIASVVVAVQLKVDARRVVRPRAELHAAQLVVEREPADVDLARAQEHTGRYPEAAAV